MKLAKEVGILLLIILLGYLALYLTLRGFKYFVHQDFTTYSVSEEIIKNALQELEKDLDVEFSSERDQIGCGRIQKVEEYPLEPTLLRIFYPLREFEMRIRGYNHVTIYAHSYDTQTFQAKLIYTIQTIRSSQ